MKENLNIAWWHRKMVLYALDKFDTQKEASKALGISERTLVRMKKAYDEGKNDLPTRRRVQDKKRKVVRK